MRRTKKMKCYPGITLNIFNREGKNWTDYGDKVILGN